MPKVLLVEDDNNLREIFQMRLQAEGYSTAVAADGEEGLVVAMKEKPDLIIADVMMPKLSGFEMIENLRSSPEMKDTKVIMMTALGQAEDQARGEKLGVVKYLVKSQVTLEDFANVIKEVLGPGDPSGAAAATSAAPTATNSLESEGTMDQSNNPTPMPGSDAPTGDQSGAMPAGGAPMPAADGQQTSAEEQSTVQNQINNFTGGSTESAGAPASGTSAPAMPSGDSGAAPSGMPSGDSGAASTPSGDSAGASADLGGTTPPAATDTPAGTGGDTPAAPAGGDQPSGGSAPTDPTSNAL
jgi:CheY-like chemotaxis protein